MTHKKFRNTGLLFELLARKLAIDAITGNNNKVITKILKSFFSTSELKKELNLYTSLLSEKVDGDEKINFFLDSVLKARKQLNQKKIDLEKYQLIGAIKENLDINEFFKTRLNNYKIYASIYKLFEGKNLTPSEVTNSRYSIIDYIKFNSKKVDNADVIKWFINENKETRATTYRLFVDKFNTKYGNTLNDNQKQLLREYINNLSGTSLQTYLSEEINKILSKFNKIISKIDNQVTKIKLEEVIKQISDLKFGNDIDDKYILTLLKCYELIEEIGENY